MIFKLWFYLRLVLIIIKICFVQVAENSNVISNNGGENTIVISNTGSDTDVDDSSSNKPGAPSESDKPFQPVYKSNHRGLLNA